MNNAIDHRGPNDSGVWVDERRGVALAHRRLSIIDISPTGHQPMVSASGRYVIVFNGEIYNFEQIRVDLGRTAGDWRGGSDTEVLLAAFDAWGIERTLSATNGMFAIAVLDIHEEFLWLARDRLGEKPLYYGWNHGQFLFASEVKAFEAHPGFRGTLDSEAISLYLRFGYVPAPWSIYGGIRKLAPGSWCRVSVSSGATGDPESRVYWRAPMSGSAAVGDVEERVASLDALLRDAVRLRMRSDVPLGAFLSGGIDSSLIAALMQSQSERPVRTFSIGFDEQEFDESVYGRGVAKALGTDHTEMVVTAADAMGVIPALPSVYDEPFADSSQIPTYLLSKLTKRHVTVALSGDGGDELFGGYHRYFQGKKLLNAYRFLPREVRALVGRGIGALPPALVAKMLNFSSKGVASLGVDRLAKLADVLGCADARDLYKRLVSQWPEPSLVFRAGQEPPTVLDDLHLYASASSSISWMMHIDQKTYLPDDILVKVDRASMAVALEARVPLLDHRVVEFAATVPESLKISGESGKWLLRRVLYRYLDKSHFARVKQGFGIPLAEWLRGPLRDWAEELLSRESLLRIGILDVDVVRSAWQEHLTGRRNRHSQIWAVLMLQSWMEHRRMVY